MAGSNTKKQSTVKVAEKEITPKRDFHIFQPPDFDIRLKEGEPATVPVRFMDNLRTEKVI